MSRCSDDPRVRLDLNTGAGARLLGKLLVELRNVGAELALQGSKSCLIASGNSLKVSEQHSDITRARLQDTLFCQQLEEQSKGNVTR